jgi:3-deoxy-manno-octulosonate cytidylyltransferase (CMP-KDO synthetase)
MTATAVLGVIPARLGSTRFPGKALFPYRGKPLLYYVWDQMRRSAQMDRIVIATDSPEIALAAQSFGAEVVRTSRKHRTGSDRVAEVAAAIPADIVVNIQGDNFGLKAGPVDRIVQAMKERPEIWCATLVRSISDDRQLFDPNVVKVVAAADNHALWFSRFPLPYLQNADDSPRCKQSRFLAHIGVYVFRRQALRQYAGWRRSRLEIAESLEQLRILENGGRIDLFRTSARTVSVDTQADLKKISLLYR